MCQNEIVINKDKYRNYNWYLKLVNTAFTWKSQGTEPRVRGHLVGNTKRHFAAGERNPCGKRREKTEGYQRNGWIVCRKQRLFNFTQGTFCPALRTLLVVSRNRRWKPVGRYYEGIYRGRLGIGRRCSTGRSQRYNGKEITRTPAATRFHRFVHSRVFYDAAVVRGSWTTVRGALVGRKIGVIIIPEETFG